MIYKVGDTLGAYRLLADCGHGAYGQVFLAENTLSGQCVALKMISRQGRSVERELQGLMRYRSCRHENLLIIHHVEQTEEFLYYTMDAADALDAGSGEYCPDTLANRLRLRGPLLESEVRSMAIALLNGLGALHQAGLIHRDIKPDNILWVGQRPVLGDIGLVSGEMSVSFAGTPGFLPPELLTGERRAAPRDDFYALGKVIYCALSGNAPSDFPRFPPGIHLTERPSLLPALLAAVSPKGIENAIEFQAWLEKPSGHTKRISIPVRLGIAAGVLGILLAVLFFSEVLSPDTSSAPSPFSTEETTAIAEPRTRHLSRVSSWEEFKAAKSEIIHDSIKRVDEAADAVPGFLLDPEWINDEAVFVISASPMWVSGMDQLYSSRDYLNMLRQSNVQVYEDGDIGIAFPGTDMTPGENRQKVLELYEQSQKPDMPSHIASKVNQVFGEVRLIGRAFPGERKQIHQEFLHNPYYQLLVLEIHLRRMAAALMTAPDDSSKPQSEWKRLAERFERYATERRNVLARYKFP